MTQELKQLREALRRVKHEAASLADAQVIALEALTQRPAAQADRGFVYTDQLARASLPTQPAAQATPDVPETDFGKMATPEPVGEPALWVLTAQLDQRVTTTRGYLWFSNPQNDSWTPLYTRPAPGVPEGLPAVLTDWGFDVHDDEDGRTWLTIRNPDDDVARMSVPTVWPLNGNQTIGAVVLHQFSAALTSALAAAQAKGGGK